jgi:hypothetical protein
VPDSSLGFSYGMSEFLDQMEAGRPAGVK